MSSPRVRRAFHSASPLIYRTSRGDRFAPPGGTLQIYAELAARWYRLLDPLEDHFDEAACYEAALLRGAPEGALTLLELGSDAASRPFATTFWPSAGAAQQRRDGSPAQFRPSRTSGLFASPITMGSGSAVGQL